MSGLSDYPGVKAILYRRVLPAERAATPDGWLVILASDPNADFIRRHPRRWEVRCLVDAEDLYAPQGSEPPSEEALDPREERLREAFEAGRAYQEEVAWKSRGD